MHPLTLRPLKHVVTSLFVAVALATSLLAVSSPVGAVIRINDGDDCPAVIAPVVNLYTAFFLREPDPQGLDYWVQYVSSSEGSLSAAAVAFAQSPEFIDRYGKMTTEEFVAQLYPNVFGRAPDARGLQFWTNDIDSGTRTRAEVIVVWSLSPEFIGEDPYYSPLAFDLQRKEVWCGSGSALIEADRIPLDVGQELVIQPVGNIDDGLSDALNVGISGVTADGTAVIQAPNYLYVHPSLGQAVDHYRVRIFDSGADVGEPTEWVVVSSWWPPPWRMF